MNPLVIASPGRCVQGAHAGLLGTVAERVISLLRACLAASASRGALVTAACAALWLGMRLLFFAGLAGSDDLHYVRFAALWDRVPANPWESRLLANALIGGCLALLGPTEVAALLPSALASLAMLGSVLYWCHRYGTIRQAWCAGLLLAVLPIDVDGATTVGAYQIMTALLTVGTVAFLEAGKARRAGWIACVALPLGIITHLAGICYLGALTLASVCCDHRRFLLPGFRLLVGACVALAVDMFVFQFAYGDALLRFRMAADEAYFSDPAFPLFRENGFNWAFATWPLTRLVFSKAFGITLSVGIALMAWQRRRPPTELLILLSAAGLYWLWMSFGSGVPWNYQPFWRITRFWQPLTLAVVVWLAWLADGITARLERGLVLAGVGGVCLLNLAGSGSWGQNVDTSRALLGYVREHGQKRFVTDYHTLNELYILNGVAPLPNVSATDEVPRSRLLDRTAVRLALPEAAKCDAILENPLNLERTPSFAHFVRRHGGAVIFEGDHSYRRICRALPPLRRYPWAIRRPPARVLECRSASAEQIGPTPEER